MNRSEIRARVRALTNIYSTALLSDAQINEVVNEVHLELCGSFQWPFTVQSTTVSVVAGTSTYALPAGTLSVLMVSRTGNVSEFRHLNAISVFDADVLPDTSANWPRYYTVENGSLTLYPAPAAGEDLTVRYTEQVDAIDDDADVPPFADEFHPVYAYATAARLLAERGASKTKVQAMNDLASQYFERMRRFYLTSTDHAPVSLGRRRWRW